MRKLFVLMLGLACLMPVMALAQEGEQESAADPMAEMEAWAAANQPGAEHEVLQRMVGDWTWTSTSQMGDSSGTMQAESIFDGRYVLHHWQGSFGGGEFEGHGVDGYDNMKGEYVSGWIDNMSTGVVTSHGECSDDDCTEMVSWSKHPGPDGEMMKSKSVTTWDGGDSFTMTMYMVPEEGDPVQHMQLVGTRVASEDAGADMAEGAMEEADAAMAEAEGAMAEAEAAADEAEAAADEAMAGADEAMAEADAAMEEAEEAMDEAADEAEAAMEDEE